MHLDAEFDGKSDFAIKRDINLIFDWLADGQSQNMVNWRTNDVLGTQRVKCISQWWALPLGFMSN